MLFIQTSTPGPALQTDGLIHSHSRSPQAPSYTPQEILDGRYTYTPPPTTSDALAEMNSRLEYVPRSPRYAGYISQSHPPIQFSVGGRPGPFLEDILRNKITLDGAQDDIFGGAWRQTKWTFDVCLTFLGIFKLMVMFSSGPALRLTPTVYTAST